MTTSEQKNWTTSVDLLLELPPARRRRAGIEDAIRSAVRSGRLPAGARLPSTRALAQDLGVSRGTIVDAYAQLAAEGWISGRTGSGTTIAAGPLQQAQAGAMRPRPDTRWRFDFRPGRPDATSFPRSEWLRALRRALATASGDAFGYGSTRGLAALRAELAEYLGRARGLRAGADDILVTTGFTQSLTILSRFLGRPARVAMEMPSMSLHRAIVRAAGNEVVPIAVDGDGLRVDELRDVRDVAMLVLTPNRQHPTGALLSPVRRSAVLAWARRCGAVVVEDDYDGEFRYDRRPIGPMQSLDPDLVIHAGTVAKTLAPGVRLGWLVLPRRHRDAVIRQKELADWQTGVLDQLAFAELLRGGRYDRHVRRMRLAYRRRRDALLYALRARVPDARPEGEAAGLNLVLPVSSAGTEASLIAAAGRAGIALDGLVTGGYYETEGRPGVLIGYAAAPEHRFRPGLEALAEVLASALGPAWGGPQPV
jgi:GntR family transcriptional regulator / MocR family aminotransferase